MIRKYFSEIFLVRRKNFRRIVVGWTKFSSADKIFLGNLIRMVGPEKKVASGGVQNPDSGTRKLTNFTKFTKSDENVKIVKFVKFRSRRGFLHSRCTFFPTKPDQR